MRRSIELRAARNENSFGYEKFVKILFVNHPLELVQETEPNQGHALKLKNN